MYKRQPAPRLVLWLTVDQLGSNVLERQARHLPGSALGRLFDEGLWFSEAAYGHAVTETAPGHATLFTGAPPCIHGIVGNEWYDRAAKRLTDLRDAWLNPPEWTERVHEVVPLGMDLWFRAQGITNVKGLDWWDAHDLGDLKVTLVPVQHWSSRTPFDRRETLWGGFVAAHGGFSMFYAGDTGYSRDFTDIGAHFGGFDFAQIPVGCYEPRWFMRNQHVNAEEAVQIHRDVKSRFSIGIHWGAFRLCDDPVEQPLDDLPLARTKLGVADSDFVLLAIGETRVLRRAP